MSEHESKAARIDDLEKPVADETAEQVKGGAVMKEVTPIAVPAPPMNPRIIVPCV